MLTVMACSPTAGTIPKYDDEDGLVRALKQLSPWEDGSSDRSHDGLTRGEWASDRATFGRWVSRYIDNEVRLQHEKDYKPFPVPSSVGEAIAAQRAYEKQEADRAAAAEAEMEAKQVEQEKEEQRLQAHEDQQREAVHQKQLTEMQATADRWEREQAAAAVRERERIACVQQAEDAKIAAGGDQAAIASIQERETVCQQM